ncbi:histidine phosphatase family protein [Methylobacterium sp. BTF04]|uniref:histidine phosphatase family protein n=1 Tax=Methylobacterium sp. BTF04 TaxID=2708300 RepID=UPI0013D08730|nr:histidine phosphatase family protein [Methylobacterium sp. BTF04]NEU14607.1 histidine phosphatase family protein [Methylobacterium sp. BTF04]
MPLHEPPAGPGTGRIYLVRHGETDWSLTGQHTGRTDLALTAHGEEQALALAPALAPIRFARAFTSPARRAQRTCSLAGLGASAEIEPDLAEWDYGDYEGKRSMDIVQGRPGWSVYRDGCPGGEIPPEVSARADRVIARLRTLDGNVAVFSHGQFGCSLGARWIGLPIVDAQHFELAPASISILGWNPNHAGLAVIARWNGSQGPTGRSSPAAP